MTFISKFFFLASLSTPSTSFVVPSIPSRISSSSSSTSSYRNNNHHVLNLSNKNNDSNEDGGTRKNSGRARLEKNLEDMMGNDWRMFRAHLVAQEHAQASWDEENKKHSSLDGESNVKQQETVSTVKQTKQDNLGTMLASIFKQKAGNNNHNHENENQHPNRQMHHQHHHHSSIFDGDNIAGASSLIPEECQDPFVSISEIPVLLEPKVKINKHRWAHRIPHVEPGCVLIANEKLGGIFHQTVLLIVDHNDKTGSTGIVINRPLEGNLLKIASEKESTIDLSLKLAFNSASVSFGGPIMPEEYSVLHGYGEVDGAKKVAPGVFVGGSAELMKEVRRQNLDPRDALFVLGHAAWVPGQLSREISKGVWYIASCSSDLILRYAGAPTSEEDNTNDLWSDVLACMGGTYAQVAERYAGKGDMRLKP